MLISQKDCTDESSRLIPMVHVYDKRLLNLCCETFSMSSYGKGRMELLRFPGKNHKDNSEIIFLIEAVLGPVVQSIVSLMTSLRGQLVKCFMTS